MNFHMNVKSKIVEICNNVKLSYLQIGKIVDKKSCETYIHELFVLYLGFFVSAVIPLIQCIYLKLNPVK